MVCDPLAPSCPDGQVCRPEAGGHVCKEPGIDEPDAAVDAPEVPFSYIAFKPGYSAAVFQDFSSNFTYVALDWQEATEVYDNQPDYLFTLDTPFPRGLGVIAGREIFTLTAAGEPEAHDYGNHQPNVGMGQADNLTGAAFVSDLDGNGPALLVSSSSEDGGDGSFRINVQWNIALDLTVNNTRFIYPTPAGTFDSLIIPTRYLGTQMGIVRRSDGFLIAPGDTRTMRLVGNDLYVTRLAGTMEQIVRIKSLTHAETMVAQRERFRLAEGAPPIGAVAWAVIDDKQLAIVRANGTVDVVAEITDPTYSWYAAVIPPAGHPLAGRLYLLESNRTRDLDRVLAITIP